VTFEPAGGEWWYIKFVHSGKCAHVHGGGKANNTPITQWDAVDQPNLKWRFAAYGAEAVVAVNHGNLNPRTLAPNTRVNILSGVGTYMHVQGGKAGEGVDITTWELVDQSNLQWQIQPVAGKPGYFFVSSAIDPNFVLHQHGNSKNNGDKCTLWNRNAANQPNMWVTFEPASGDWWNIKFAHSGKCAHVHGGVKGNGTQITQWDAVDQPNLKWRFVSAHVDPRTLIPSTTVNILSGVGTYMHVQGGRAAESADITTWQLVDQSNLQWQIHPVPGRPGTFFVASAIDPNFVLHQYGATKTNGDKCTLWNRNAANQPNLWVTFDPAGDNWWYIRFVHSGKCAHVHGGVKGNGTPITQWDSCDQPNLKWRFIPK